MRRWKWLCAILTVAILVQQGCAAGLDRRLTAPQEYFSLDRQAPFLKVHLKDGGLLVLSRWDIDDASDMIRGEGRLFDPARRLVATGVMQTVVDSVAVFETNTAGTSGAVAPLALLTGVSLAITAYCIANPKACFGSCPTFYVTDGEKPVLQAEGFSASIAPSLEASDVDALYRARPSGRRVTITMTNEALETHVLRSADLLIVPRDDGERVFVTPERRFWATSRMVPPSAGVGPEGDCRGELVDFDGVERISVSDSTDLAAREDLDLVFENPPGGRCGLVIATRQSLLSTYLFYQALAYMGRSAGEWLARLERGEAGVRRSFSAAGGVLGRIEVLIDRDGAWMPAGSICEPGPLATDVVMVPLDEEPSGPLRLRLRMTRGMHRIDWTALVALEREMTPLRVAPASVLRLDEPGPELRDVLVDSTRTLVTLPGDRYGLEYELPGEASGYEIFLVSRGYYLEWIREEWLKEENPLALARLFLSPAQAMRDLAPEFKKVEPEMEAAFWGSRYAHP